MTCTSPPELDDIQLLTYVDSEADQQVVAHIDRCPHCREKARRLARLQDRLTARLFRVTCPSPEELGEYHLQVLPSERADAVARHLAECPHCTHEVVQLKAYLRELAPTLEPSRLGQVKERARVLIAQLVSGGEGGALPLAPVPAGIRGEEEGPYIYQAGDVQIAIEVQDDTDQPHRRVILGLVTGTEDTRVLEAHLWQADQSLVTVPVDDLGNFVIPHLVRGDHELIISGPDMEIHIQSLEV
ncbi:MAG: hypothetical protein ACE5LU_10370 [Anaerolineae bacterium]